MELALFQDLTIVWKKKKKKRVPYQKTSRVPYQKTSPF